jgi:hypothetical protein
MEPSKAFCKPLVIWNYNAVFGVVELADKTIRVATHFGVFLKAEITARDCVAK